MIVLAIGQAAFFNMSVYAQVTEYRPNYVLVCRYLGFGGPEYENYDELRTCGLVIRSHPDELKTLLIDAILLNSGPFTHTFPGLKLQSYEVHDEVVASRVLEVYEYFGGEIRGLKWMPAETEVRLSLEVIDPGNDAFRCQLEVVRL